jgi:2-polyprenyl-3-methyl-5-hydroxy-6-metoxy-1,4-benzoquinol methylase
MEHWYAHSFGADYLIVYKHRDMEKAKAEVAAMALWMQLKPGAQLFDLCCGMGRHAISLAELGYQVTGLDLSQALLAEAKKWPGAEHVRWVCGDMREVAFAGKFDAVVNLFTSFGYFESDVENKQVLAHIRAALKPGGKWLVDFLNAEYVVDHLVPVSERVQDGYAIRETRSIEANSVVKHIALTRPDGTKAEYWERVKLYDLAWFEQACAEVGLAIEAVYGNYDQTSVGESSPRLILMGKVAEQ